MSHGFDLDLDLGKQKRFFLIMIIFLYDYMSGLKKFKEQLPTKEKFYSPLTGKKLAIKSISIF